jgi:hypothetical protein
MYSTADTDSALLDHDLNSFQFYDLDGSIVPDAVTHAVAEAFESILSDVWARASAVDAGTDKPLSAAMEDAMAAYASRGGTAIPLDGSTLPSRILMWMLSSWEVRTMRWVQSCCELSDTRVTCCLERSVLVRHQNGSGVVAMGNARIRNHGRACVVASRSHGSCGSNRSWRSCPVR